MSKEFIAPPEPKTAEETEAFEETFLKHKQAASSERRAESISQLTPEQEGMLKNIKRIDLEWPLVGEEMGHTYPKISAIVEISGERYEFILTGPGGDRSDRDFLLDSLSDQDENRFTGNIKKSDSGDEDYVTLAQDESKDLFMFYLPLVGILDNPELSKKAEAPKNADIDNWVQKLQGK